MLKALLLGFAVIFAHAPAAMAGGTNLGNPGADKENAERSAPFGSFSRADKNRDSAITKDEWTEFLQTHRGKAPDFDNVDSDGNGSVTVAEWKKHSNSEEGSSSTGASDGASGK